MQRPSRDSARVERQWLWYSVAGAACAVAGGLAEPAAADSYYSGELNLNMTSPTANDPLYTPLQSQVARQTLLQFSNRWHYNEQFTSRLGHDFANGNVQVAGFATLAYNFASRLQSGAPLSYQDFNPTGARNILAIHSGLIGYSQFVAPGPALLGFRFSKSSGDGLCYGWARVQMGGPPFDAMTLIDWAYSDQPGFAAGQIPEPASLGLLAAGALGVLAWRRMR